MTKLTSLDKSMYDLVEKLEEAKVEREKALANLKHEHQFTIPVEWKTYGPGGTLNPDFDYTLITKLRCICGEEIER